MRTETAQLRTEVSQRENEMCDLHCEMRQKDSEIGALRQQIADLQRQLSSFGTLENQTWKAMEEINVARYEAQKYRDSLERLQEHLEEFKRLEVSKFNFVLQMNAQQFFALKSESEAKDEIIEKQKLEIKRISAEFAEQKVRLKFCEEKMFDEIARVDGNKEKTDSHKTKSVIILQSRKQTNENMDRNEETNNHHKDGSVHVPIIC